MSLETDVTRPPGWYEPDPDTRREFDELPVRNFAWSEIRGSARDALKTLAPVLREYVEAIRIEAEGTDYEPTDLDCLGWFLEELGEDAREVLEKTTRR